MTAKAVIYSPFLWDSGTEQQPEQAGGFHAVYGGEVLKRPDFSAVAQQDHDHGKQDAAGACQHLTEGKTQKI